ncbi:chromosome segregation protein SMC [Mesobaculum littorinae]|uniref:Chromosome partition protein Smc n=1 Tax=Mesobaculum littorinae TaxID=2486419 RepID=A0A438AGI7_9RHOB|nr:AAA family ATPase [Mesobaculum littorinae]RVV97812.1 chromosome segregation protein SMC [Mesobaculum littorinae]
MRFTRLRLNGFKSFVDPTDLVIAPGLTGVVGPNGCGKSNLLEALRWVMGENRPTAMRGGGMEDVIFAGAATRPARNFAEVTLSIDNADRLAPASFNDADTLEIVRRITRDAGSAFRANARDVRARDVQMLFADASTGSQSPALVRQGQISELINAKPRARRRILEDAAGIAGLYQRRHEAELKLKGAEANLERVQDIVEQLAQQLGTLARQARQAARYRTIGEDLRQAEGRLLYCRWQDAEAARQEATAALRTRAAEAAAADRAVQEAEAARAAREEALPPLREEEAIAAAVLQRLTVERDGLKRDEDEARARIGRLRGRIAQLERDGERERTLNRDAGETLDTLTEEAAALEAADDGHDARLAEAREAAEVAGVLLGQRETALSEATEEAARLAARHHSARRLVDDSRTARDRAEAEAERARTAVGEAETALARAEAATEEAQGKDSAAADLAARAEAALTAADAARTEAQTQEAEARAARSSAEGELGALSAEASALARLVERDGSDSGQVLDLVRVNPGYEQALGAALADDLRAPAVRDGTGSGWVDLGPCDGAPALPDGAEPLAGHVRVPGVLGRRIAQVGLVAPGDGPRLQAALRPGQRLVTRAGDLWRWDGFRATAEDAPSAAALRLQQINRLEDLRRQEAEARSRGEAAAQEHEARKARLSETTEADRAARAARREADQEVAQASRALSRAEADRTIAAGKLETQRMAVGRHEDEAKAARARLKEAETAMQGLANLDAAKARAETAKAAAEGARITMMTARAGADELKREGEARASRRTAVARERETWETRLETAGTRLAEIEERLASTRRDLKSAEAAPAGLAARRAEAERGIDAAGTRRGKAAEALAAGEAALREAATVERKAGSAAGEAREARAAADARAEAAADAVEAAALRISEELDLTPDALRARLAAAAAGEGESAGDAGGAEGANAPETATETAPSADGPAAGAAPRLALPPAAQLESEVQRLRRQRDSLGAVNLRAEEDAREVQEEHDLLVTEKADLEEAIRALRTGIATLNREGRERLLAAFEQVNANFTMLFTHLFGGGDARLELVESDDPLEAGLEILCQPPGKKLQALSLLSGGEQTLTALALIFGVFLANPAPICVLDEVDAPLDDANVTRFCDLLDEMTRQTETRFLIITHHAVTMSRMDRLFGVTMGEQGVSQLVSVDLKKAEQMVA